MFVANFRHQLFVLSSIKKLDKHNQQFPSKISSSCHFLPWCECFFLNFDPLILFREAERVRYKKKLVLGQLVPNSYLALMEEINKLKVSSDQY